MDIYSYAFDDKEELTLYVSNFYGVTRRTSVLTLCVFVLTYEPNPYAYTYVSYVLAISVMIPY